MANAADSAGAEAGDDCAELRDIVPLVGARRRDRLAESLAALDLKLTPEDLAAIEAAVPPEAVAGDRYDTWAMSTLDSERGG